MPKGQTQPRVRQLEDDSPAVDATVEAQNLANVMASIQNADKEVVEERVPATSGNVVTEVDIERPAGTVVGKVSTVPYGPGVQLTWSDPRVTGALRQVLDSVVYAKDKDGKYTIEVNPKTNPKKYIESLDDKNIGFNFVAGAVREYEV